MSRPKTPKQYGFTTTESDPYLLRVGAEAKPIDNFIIASAKRPEGAILSLLVRKTALPRKMDGFKLLDQPIGKTFGAPLPGTQFRALSLPVSNLKRATNQAKDVVQRIKNHNLGRTVKVLVEAV